MTGCKSPLELSDMRKRQKQKGNRAAHKVYNLENVVGNLFVVDNRCAMGPLGREKNTERLTPRRHLQLAPISQ